jgi:hypothetical protein
MWEVPRYRIRRYLRQLRKTRAEGKKPERPVFHIKRTQAEITVLEGFAAPKKVVQACVVLNDLTPSGLLLFSSEPFYPGQRINLTLESPKLFYARGHITACKHMSLHQHVVGEHTYPYRVAIRFEFGSHEEELSVRRYCQEIYTRYLYGPARSA